MIRALAERRVQHALQLPGGTVDGLFQAVGLGRDRDRVCRRSRAVTAWGRWASFNRGDLSRAGRTGILRAILCSWTLARHVHQPVGADEQTGDNTMIRVRRSLYVVIALLWVVQPCDASRIEPKHVAEILARHTGEARAKAGAGATHFVYLYPTDRPFRTDYLEAVQTSATTLQGWYAAELEGYTPTLAEVTSVALDQPAAFYGQPEGGGDPYLTFWNKVLDDVLPKTGAAFNDPNNVWVFLVDAPAGCAQLSGGATSGIAVMSHNDLRGLLGEEALACDGSPAPSESFFPDRWIGGQGHELGHAYGLPHPPGCDDGLATCDQGALMWSGFYYGFPSETYLRADEKTFLIQGTYVQDPEFFTIHESGFEPRPLKVKVFSDFPGTAISAIIDVGFDQGIMELLSTKDATGTSQTLSGVRYIAPDGWEVVIGLDTQGLPTHAIMGHDARVIHFHSYAANTVSVTVALPDGHTEEFANLPLTNTDPTGNDYQRAAMALRIFGEVVDDVLVDEAESAKVASITVFYAGAALLTSYVVASNLGLIDAATKYIFKNLCAPAELPAACLTRLVASDTTAYTYDTLADCRKEGAVAANVKTADSSCKLDATFSWIAFYNNADANTPGCFTVALNSPVPNHGLQCFTNGALTFERVVRSSDNALVQLQYVPHADVRWYFRNGNLVGEDEEVLLIHQTPTRTVTFAIEMGGAARYVENYQWDSGLMGLGISCDTNSYTVLMNSVVSYGSWACPVELPIPPLFGDPFAGFWSVPYSIRCVRSPTQTEPMC